MILKTKILILLLTTVTCNLFAQFNAYYPDGKKITIKYETIGSLLDSLGINESESYSHKLGYVYFKRLSNKPIFVFFMGKEYPLKVKEMISSYNYTKYLNSYSYYHDLKDMIKEETLTKNYLKDVFNEPSLKGQNENASEYWIFKNYNVKIIFENDTAKSVDVINYKAVQRNELAISSFDVTGDDYSIGFEISLNNCGRKTIKYTFITVTATNPVDDKVDTKTVKAVGPIRPSDTGTYEFNNIIYSNTAKYLSIDNIKLQFMDGTFKIISKAEVKNITLQDWEEIGNRTIED